ncbi:KPHMT1 [Acrasis kona]|uniref:KPHMT1 n=1 Tax=Acrasis kona TaxID=1008807 RepID=A0AAW2Z7C3_9EUKA
MNRITVTIAIAIVLFACMCHAAENSTNVQGEPLTVLSSTNTFSGLRLSSSGLDIFIDSSSAGMVKTVVLTVFITFFGVLFII